MKIGRVDRRAEPLPALTTEKAQECYSYFAQGLNETQQFEKHGVPFEYSKQVRKEIESMESTIEKEMRKETKPNDSNDLAGRLTSPLGLVVSTLVQDYIKFHDGKPEIPKDFATFSSKFISE